MAQLTLEKAKELLKKLQYAKAQMGQLSLNDEMYKQALEIAITILEQQGETDITKVLDKVRGMETYWKAQCRGITDHCENLQEKITELTYENAGLKGSVENAAGCISAAYFEGLADALEESSDERLVDLVKRRLLLSYLPVETPTTNDALVVMGDVVLLDQLEDSRKAIVTLSNIIDLQDKRIFELEQQGRINDDWIVWPGGNCPIDKNKVVYVKFRDGDVDNNGAKAGTMDWFHFGEAWDIIAYRLVKP